MRKIGEFSNFYRTEWVVNFPEGKKVGMGVATFEPDDAQNEELKELFYLLLPSVSPWR